MHLVPFNDKSVVLVMERDLPRANLAIEKLPTETPSQPRIKYYDLRHKETNAGITGNLQIHVSESSLLFRLQ